MYISLNREWQFADESGKIKTVDLPHDAMLMAYRAAGIIALVVFIIRGIWGS